MSRMSVGFFTRRAQTCQQLTRMLQQNGLVMVRGPPRSGKTSLCQLMAITARHSSIFQQVFYVNCAAVSSVTSFQSQFQRRILDHPTPPYPIMIFAASSHRHKPLASMEYTAPLAEFAATRSAAFRYSLAALQFMLCCYLLPASVSCHSRNSRNNGVG